MLKPFISALMLFAAIAAANAQGDFLVRPSPIAGRTFLTLSLFTEVRTDLKTSKDVNGKIDDLKAKLQDEMQQAFTDAGGDANAMHEAIKKVNAKYDLETLKVLSDDQVKRLKGLYIQFNGSGAASDPLIGKDVALTDDQWTKVKKLEADQFKKMFDVFSAGSSPEDTAKAISEMYDDFNKGMDKVLTDDQKAKLKDMAGAKFEFKKADSG